MVMRGIRGQSLSSTLHRAALFGGFDDEFMVVDGLTGRVMSIECTGRTILYPWAEDHFVSIEDALGRPTKTSICLRPYADPSAVDAHISAGELPGAVEAIWGPAQTIPGHYPTAFRVGDGEAVLVRRPRWSDGEAAVAFVPGVFSDDGAVPLSIDGSLVWGEAARGCANGPSVGHGSTVWSAASDGLAVSNLESSRIGEPRRARDWRPAAIEHDAAEGRVLVASWNRWRALGGPSSDIYVFDELGIPMASARADRLVERMAFTASGITVVDVAGSFAFVAVAGPAV